MLRATCSKSPGEGSYNRSAYLILDAEDIFDVTVVALGPNMSSGCSLDQLGRDSEPLPSFAQATLDEIFRTEFASYTLHVYRAVAVLEGRVPGNHEKLPAPGEFGDYVLCNA